MNIHDAHRLALLIIRRGSEAQIKAKHETDKCQPAQPGNEPGRQTAEIGGICD